MLKNENMGQTSYFVSCIFVKILFIYHILIFWHRHNHSLYLHQHLQNCLFIDEYCTLWWDCSSVLCLVHPTTIKSFLCVSCLPVPESLESGLGASQLCIHVSTAFEINLSGCQPYFDSAKVNFYHPTRGNPCHSRRPFWLFLFLRLLRNHSPFYSNHHAFGNTSSVTAL